jgi:peptide deformylase
MNLVKSTDPILQKELADVDLKNPGFDPKELKEQMTELMVSKRGLGLSACQVGLDHKLFIIGENKENCMMFINPEVISVSEETELDVEGCLSYPDMFIRLARPKQVEAKWYDEELKEQSGSFEGYTARCFLHEFDHLYGVVYKDKVSRLKWDRARTKKDKITKQRNKLMAYLQSAQSTINQVELRGQEVAAEVAAED